ncbi:MAG: hypothetical protein LUH09_05510 [Clostridiales bacterium]|nr:hypothetical protein [Clostridiales bacterium]
MATFRVDTDNVKELAAAIQVLAVNFDTEISIPDSGSCCGSGVMELEPICQVMAAAKKQLYELMSKTAAFMNTTSAAFEQSDLKNAERLLVDIGVIDRTFTTGN